MRIAKLSLICLVAFAFMVGCGMIGKEAEMSETANTTSAGKAVMEAEAETMAKESMEGAAVEEVTLNVTGMT
ncbi:hypothetical protein C6496_08470 [Candidatus Poribacteria bacterium]|nr:MAG: hypothetical protein C6496_08470 [Candidatus Poribacteria bacterium]